MAVVPAEDSFINFVEMKFIDGMLYFVAENDDDLESDRFGKLEPPKYSIIRNLDNQVLFIHQRTMPIFQDMPDSDCKDNPSQTILEINTYKDDRPRGSAVTISAKYEKSYTLSCENKIVTFKEIEPPSDIYDTKSDIIFFQQSVPGHDDKIQFESSLHEEHFLACKKEGDLFRLILKEKDKDGDTSVMFTLQNEI
ncbi:interleukin-18 [Perognathus longimembris pacificus]|uniref:interleukin-18 n=1 Tax=Perognathus longimembris pacificus TaxID=214514 RepID=UPI0020199205|nr:interleukin-18 [Perognathus longimembris pacificus]XP_048196932.1 interleukin-18 [Perognathus longimembris pacificus]